MVLGLISYPPMPGKVHEPFGKILSIEKVGQRHAESVM